MYVSLFVHIMSRNMHWKCQMNKILNKKLFKKKLILNIREYKAWVMLIIDYINRKKIIFKLNNLDKEYYHYQLIMLNYFLN